MAYQNFSFGEPLKSYQHRWSLDASQLGALNVDTDSPTDIEFIVSGDGSSYIELSGNLKQEMIDKLQKAEPAGNGFQLDLTDRNFEFLSLDFQTANPHITVALPDSRQFDHVQFDFHSGSGKVSGLKARHAELKVYSGSLNISDAAAEQLKLESASGNVTAENIQAALDASVQDGNMTLKQITGEGTYKVMSGNIKTDFISGHINMETTDGNITMDHFTGEGVLKTFSGNVTLSNQRSDELDITVVDGNVKLSEDEAFQGLYDLRADDGSVHAPEAPQKTNDVIKIRTNSGNITVK
nr:DUF4097 family beta strand repeat-containing protein [Paenibacillus caui]